MAALVEGLVYRGLTVGVHGCDLVISTFVERDREDNLKIFQIIATYTATYFTILSEKV